MGSALHPGIQIFPFLRGEILGVRLIDELPEDEYRRTNGSVGTVGRILADSREMRLEGAGCSSTQDMSRSLLIDTEGWSRIYQQ